MGLLSRVLCGVAIACGVGIDRTFAAGETTAISAVRVAVAQNQAEVSLAVHGQYRIVSPDTAQALQEGHGLSSVAVRASREGLLVGGSLLPVGGVRVEPARDATIDVNGQRLRGALEIRRQPDQTLLVINHVELEDYLRGVLSKEAPHDWPMEALKALAIAARTYTLFQRLTNTTNAYDVTGDVMSQVYGGHDAERWRTDRAVAQTTGLVLLDRGQLVPAFYHSTCGGLTEQASVMGEFDLAPLQGGLSCSFCVASPFYRWQHHLTMADLAWAVTQSGRPSVWPVTALEIVEYSPTGRIAALRIRGASRSLRLSGYEFRAMLGFERIRSTAFAIVPDADGQGVTLQGRGWGHGVGLCQWGAAGLAREGLSAVEIVAFYYPTAELVDRRERLIQPIPVHRRF